MYVCMYVQGMCVRVSACVRTYVSVACAGTCVRLTVTTGQLFTVYLVNGDESKQNYCSVYA